MSSFAPGTPQSVIDATNNRLYGAVNPSTIGGKGGMQQPRTIGGKGGFAVQPPQQMGGKGGGNPYAQPPQQMGGKGGGFGYDPQRSVNPPQQMGGKGGFGGFNPYSQPPGYAQPFFNQFGRNFGGQPPMQQPSADQAWSDYARSQQYGSGTEMDQARQQFMQNYQGQAVPAMERPMPPQQMGDTGGMGGEYGGYGGPLIAQQPSNLQRPRAGPPQSAEDAWKYYAATARFSRDTDMEQAKQNFMRRYELENSPEGRMQQFMQNYRGLPRVTPPGLQPGGTALGSADTSMTAPAIPQSDLQRLRYDQSPESRRQAMMAMHGGPMPAQMGGKGGGYGGYGGYGGGYGGLGALGALLAERQRAAYLSRQYLV